MNSILVRINAILFLTWAMLIMFAPVAFANSVPAAVHQVQSTSDNQALEGQQSAGGSSQTFSVKPVSPTEFTGRVNKLVGGINTAVSGLIVPLAVFSMLVSVVALALGSLIGLQAVRRFGWNGLFFTAIALIIFWGIPVIIGLIRSLATSFAG